MTLSNQSEDAMSNLIKNRVLFQRGLWLSVCAAALAGCATVAPEATPDIAPVTTDAPAIVEQVEAPAAIAPAFSEEGIAALEAAMAAYVEEGRVYGIHTRLTHKGEVISDTYSGLRGLEAAAPIEQDTIYRIYSMTKPITGVAMMMLWEEGKFDLDDPITKFVPEFEGLKVLGGVDEAGAPILVDPERAPTMRELMSHTSGFGYGLAGADPVNTAFRDLEVLQSPDLQTFIDRTASIPLLFQPGDAWYYSVGMDIQGHIIEKLSGQTFGEFLQTRMFEPLGMTDTGFYVPEEDYDRFSEVYGFDPETGALVPVPYPSVAFRKDTVGFESGGGGLVSTMDDYARFSQMLVNRGELDGVRIIKPETLDVITTDALPDGASIYLGADPLDGLGMGLTFGTVTDAEAVPTQTPTGTYFWGGAASTWFWIDPVNELHFIGMVQIFDNNNPNGSLELRETSSAAIYQALTAD
jgi:CubicO group peptidase (beta-lactamase class C family)